MTDVSELLRDAQYEFQNVSQTGTDSKKHAARARSLAHKIIRKSPDSREATAARSILERLGERVPAPPGAKDRPANHSRPLALAHKAREPRPPVTTRTFSSPRPSPKTILRQHMLPGWPVRLLQTIFVFFGMVLVLRGIALFSLSQPDFPGLGNLVAGGLLVYFPVTSKFNTLVSYARTRLFADADWSANVEHLPTRRDVGELVEAVWKGNSGKRIVVIVVLLFAFSWTVAAIYVFGARKAFDAVEGWLLGRKGGDVTEAPDDLRRQRDLPK